MRAYAGTWLSGVVLSAALVVSAVETEGTVAEVAPVASSSVADSGVLEIHVVDHRGKPVEVRVTGCRDDVYPVARLRLETRRSCTVQARRRDGAFWTPWTTPVTTTTGHLAVDLPDYTMGGLGVRIRASRQGAIVDGAESRSPGQKLGLEPGDVIVRADGVSLAGRSVEAMTEVITGASGTAVELEIIDVRSGSIRHRTGYRAPHH